MRTEIHCHPEYAHLESEVLDLISSFSSTGQSVSVQKRNVIKSFQLGDLKLNIKSFKKPNAFNAFVYKYIRKSKARRSFDYACRLIRCGISTPFPVAYIEAHSIFGLGHSYYVSLHIDFDLEFRDLIHQPWFKDRDLLLRKFTAFTFKMHENRINFLDHSPGNTLIINRDGEVQFYLIDLNRMRFEAMDFKKRMHNFRRLWLSKAMIKIMAKAYSELYYRSYEDTHDVMLKYSRAFQLKINKKKLRRSGRKMQFKRN